jgi:hypothetical protein
MSGRGEKGERRGKERKERRERDGEGSGREERGREMRGESLIIIADVKPYLPNYDAIPSAVIPEWIAHPPRPPLTRVSWKPEIRAHSIVWVDMSDMSLCVGSCTVTKADEQAGVL